jgi:enhancing lycopene biosynthesis protein 2
LAIPGGFGAAKNLCTYAVDGVSCQVNPEVARLINEMRAAQKPIAAICIAPVLLAKVLGKEVGPSITIGNDTETAGHIGELGGRHVDCAVDDFVVDKEANLVTTPAYMLAQSVAEAASGIEKTIQALIEMA